MAKQVKLTAERRETTGRSAMRKLKQRGIIPAIVYGGQDKAQPLQVSRRDISVMLSHASGENILVELEIAGEKSSRMAMIQEIQHSPVGGECLPGDLPDKITVDVSALNIGDSIHVRDIKLPDGVTAKTPVDLTAFSVLAPAVEEEPVAAVAETAAGPEVIKEKKEEGEAATPAATGAAKAATPAAKEKEAKK